jgi:hypothetical protein
MIHLLHYVAYEPEGSILGHYLFDLKGHYSENKATMFVRFKKKEGWWHASIEERCRREGRVITRYRAYLGREPWFITKDQAQDNGLDPEAVSKLELLDLERLERLGKPYIPERFPPLPVHLPVLESETWESARNCQAFWDQIKVLYTYTLGLFCIALLLPRFIEYQSDLDVIMGWAISSVNNVFEDLAKLRGFIPRGNAFLKLLYSKALMACNSWNCAEPTWVQIMRAPYKEGKSLSPEERDMYSTLREPGDWVALLLFKNGVPPREVDLAVEVIHQGNRIKNLREKLALFCLARVLPKYPKDIERRADLDVVFRWAIDCADCTLGQLADHPAPISCDEVYSEALEWINKNLNPATAKVERFLFEFFYIMSGETNFILPPAIAKIFRLLRRLDSAYCIERILRDNGVPPSEVRVAIDVVRNWERQHEAQARPS